MSSSTDYEEYNDVTTLTSKGAFYPNPPHIIINSFEEYCSVTNKIINKWRSKAFERQKIDRHSNEQASLRYVGEILPWFRGQTNAEHCLTPSVARLVGKYSGIYDDIPTVEQYFQERFIRFARPYLASIQPNDIVEWNYIMRHHEVPSRLLDWTKGSLIGLYYAVHNIIESKYRMPTANPSPQERDCAVWMLEPRRLMELATAKTLKAGIRNIASQDPTIKDLRMLYFGGSREKFIDGLEEKKENYDGITDYPIPLIPSHISRRLESHLSRFTLHSLDSSNTEVKDALPKKDTSLNMFAKDSFHADNSFWYLIKLIIPASKREEIARNLRMTGIGDMNFSQDLDGLSKELEIRFRLGAKDDKIHCDYSS